MAVDREAALKKAEKLLRQGKLDGAIEGYVRLVEDQPRDWNSINVLGDLYVRAGDADRAVTQFTRVADYLFGEGFLPKAAALYKKALKAKGDHEHTLLQLADIAAHQGLLADAKTYLRQLADQRRLRGDERGAAEYLIRLGTLEEADAESQIAAARAAEVIGDTKQAAALLKNAGDHLETQGRRAEALEAFADALRLDPEDRELRRRLVRECVRTGHLERARPFLTLESAGDDPDLLLTLGQTELALGSEERARAILTRVLTIAPGRHGDVTQMALDLARDGRLASAVGCIDVVTDAALLGADWDHAVDALQTFVRAVPHVPALIKLVELSVDAGLDAPLRDAQAQLADAYLQEGRGAEARIISEDLLDHDPGSEAHARRLLRALDLLGVADADRLVAERLSGGTRPTDIFDGIDLAPTEAGEIDLSEALARIGAVPRELASSDPADEYDRAVEHLHAGRVIEAIAGLQAVAHVPQLRFKAAAQLGRLHIARGEVDAGIAWLERAAGAPASTPEESCAVLYDLADALDRLGESARALALLIELDADAGDYRDVRARIEQLRRARAGIHGG